MGVEVGEKMVSQQHLEAGWRFSRCSPGWEVVLVLHHRNNRSLLPSQTGRPRPVTPTNKNTYQTNWVFTWIIWGRNAKHSQGSWEHSHEGKRSQYFPNMIGRLGKKSLSLETDVLCAIEKGWLRGRGVGREEWGCVLSWQQPQEDHGGKNSWRRQACSLCSPRCSDCTMLGIGNHSSLFFSLSAERFGYSLQYIRKILFSS